MIMQFLNAITILGNYIFWAQNKFTFSYETFYTNEQILIKVFAQPRPH